MNKFFNYLFYHIIKDEIGSLCDSGGKYEDAPHIIEILLPTICSYLTHWWSQGPSAAAASANSMPSTITPSPSQTSSQYSNKKPDQPIAAIAYSQDTTAPQILTAVTSDLMNQVLGCILRLISNNIEVKNATWMNTIASFSQSIISSSTTTDLLQKNFLPVSAKIVEKARELIQREMSMKSFSRNVDSTDRESIESDLQKGNTLLKLY